MATLSQYLEDQLRQRITAMSVGSKLPTEAELCLEFSVSRMTVNKVLKRLASEGLLVRNRRRGTFVQAHSAQPVVEIADVNMVPAKEISSWLERGNPTRTVFALRTQVYRINIDECVFAHRRHMWEQMLGRIEQQVPRVKFSITTESANAEHADLVLFSLRSDLAQHVSTEPVARQAVQNRCPRSNYFAAAWTGLDSRHLAACPFAVSTDLYIWNLPLLQRHCPSFDGQCPTRMVDFILERCAWQAPDFSPVASFMFYPPIQWHTEGLDYVDPASRIFKLGNERVRRYLEFNRYMAERSQSICGDTSNMNPRTLWQLFNNNQLLGINTYSGTLAVMPPRRQAQFMVHTPSVANQAVMVPVYMGIGRSCRNHEGAADIIRLICGNIGQPILIEHYGNIPALRQAAFSSEFLDSSPLNMQAVLETLDSSTSLMDSHPFLLVEQPHFDNFARYMLGEIDIDGLCRIVNPASPA